MQTVPSPVLKTDMSFEQERMWLIDHLASVNPCNHIGGIMEFQGVLQIPLLEKALDCLIERHESLRTCFSSAEGKAQQSILAPFRCLLPVIDLRDATDEAQCEAITQLLQEPFDLSEAPAWRVQLQKLDDERFQLVLCMHHIICDGDRSIELFFQELSTFQQALLEGEAAPLSELPIQYRDFALQQREQWTENILQPHQKYWCQKLDSISQAMPLPMDHPRPVSQTFHGDCQTFTLDQLLAERLKNLSQQAGIPLCEAALATFKLLLFRLSNQSDIVVGFPSKGRHFPGTENLIGHFGNPFVLLTEMSGQLSFMELLSRVNQVMEEAMEHQDYPFQNLIQDLKVKRDPSIHPLFQVLFHWREETFFSDVDCHSIPYDLLMSVKNSENKLIWTLNYNTDLFESETITRMLGHCQQLLVALLANPEQPIGKLTLLSESEQRQVMEEWNACERVEYDKVCVHTQIEEQVLKTPDGIAVEFQNESLTYAQLNGRANQLARHLQKLEVEPDQMVGLCMGRSIEMLVAVLGILKAGGAYVPLDADYPKERLSYMLSDSQIEVVLTTVATVKSSPQIEEITKGIKTIVLDREWSKIEEEEQSNLKAKVKSHHLAYCIYTSGSTGNPKGVLMEHQALSNLLAWHSENWLSEEGTRVLLFSPISFDVSFHEIAAAWCTGGTLVQLEETTRRNPLALLEFIQQQKIEKLYLPFVALQQLAQATDRAGMPMSLREMIIGGEPLFITPEISNLLRQTGCVLHNQYGSTECLVITAYTLAADGKNWPVQVPVGRPTIHNTRVYVLDKGLQTVPIGVTGEIYADSDCLARGYHNQPELTEERFIPNPFRPDFSGRLYKVGDLGRYLPDGNIECLGRADHQVKIRGFRVELGEVEACILTHPLVKECAVVPREDVPGNRRLVAYVIPHSQQDQLEQSVRGFVKEKLPEYMVPSVVMGLEKFNLTPSGKVDRRQLPVPTQERPELDTRLLLPQSDLEHSIVQIWKAVLQVEEVGIHDNFFELGGNSLLIVQTHKKLEDCFDMKLSPVLLFQYPTVQVLAQHLKKHLSEKNKTPVSATVQKTSANPKLSLGKQDIAIIGMSCRLPGSENPDEFWNNLKEGVESIQTFSDEEIQQIDPSLLNDPNYVKAGSVLNHIDQFDASFFGYSGKEAELTDPQQRLLLECAWEAFEQAGYQIQTHEGEVGVFTGAGISTYLINNVAPHLGFSAHHPFVENEALQAKLCNDRSYYSTRISYKMNLRGPSLNVQTACSTSLVTVHLACRSLLNGECDMALAGGAAVVVPHKTGYLYQENLISSPDGHCRAFDADAQGTLFGNGVGVVVLKLLDQAVADGDSIVAVIKGSAINNDGALKVGYSAPGVEGQASVISRALANAEVEASSVSYVETHGTATAMGDPVEVAALTQAFSKNQEGPNKQGRHCAIGSVKTNLGHLDEAAGIASLLKTALALKHQQIPPSLHFKKANPQIDFEDSPFYVNTALVDWKKGESGKPRRAGVSSFGMGGTNCHLILEEAPKPKRLHNIRERKQHLLTLSAKTPDALHELVQRYQSHLKSHPEVDLADLCFTANTGRHHFSHRLAWVAETQEALCEQLQKSLQNPASFSVVPSSKKKIAMLFTGQGSQHVNMGRTLYETQPIFRQVLEHCDQVLQPQLSMLEVLFSENTLIDQTSHTQALLFALEYALFQLWKSWGVEPDVVMGHSVGEYVAACVAGVFSLEEGLKLMAERGRLMQALPSGGTMVSVQASESQIKNLLRVYRDNSTPIAIAAINSPQSLVISGECEAIQQFCVEMEAQGIKSKPLNVSHAFHSPLMEPMLEELEQVIREMDFGTPQMKLVSNLTGKLAGAEVTTPEYWSRHTRQTVQFSVGMASIQEEGVDVFIEIGPKPVLLGLGQQCEIAEAIWLPCLRAQQMDEVVILNSLKELHLQGVDIDWAGFDRPYHRRRVPLPTYPFQRKSYWVGADTKADPFSDCIYHVEWQAQEGALRLSQKKGRHWLILADEKRGLGKKVAQLLRAQEDHCTLAFFGDQKGSVESFAALLEKIPDLYGIVNCWSLDADNENLEQANWRTCRSTLHLLQALFQKNDLQSSPRLWLVTQGGQAVAGEAVKNVSQVPLWGLGKTIAWEHPELKCVQIDLAAETIGEDAQALFSELVSCPADNSPENQIAFRQQKRFVPRLASHQLCSGASATPLNFSNGRYLITGGLGGLGLQCAHFLAEHGAEHLVLLGRKGASLSVQNSLRPLLDKGIQISVVEADVSNREQMARVFADVESLTPPLKGIIHTAGILDDGVLQKQSWPLFEKVMAPKVQGAWNLHHLTQNRPLDFFILFSSTSSLFGTAGQANYVAANAFLDGLASYRNAQGLPCLSINWGAWKEVGITARLQANDKLEKKGENSFSPQRGLQFLKQLLQEPQAKALAQVGVTSIDWPRFLAGPMATSPFFNNFRAPGETTATEVAQIQSFNLEQLRVEVSDQVSKILGESNEVLQENEDLGFFDLGMDSLGSIELRNNLQNRLEHTLPITLAIDYPTVSKLANFLFEEVFNAEETDASRGSEEYLEKDTSLDEVAEQLAKQIDI